MSVLSSIPAAASEATETPTSSDLTALNSPNSPSSVKHQQVRTLLSDHVDQVLLMNERHEALEAATSTATALTSQLSTTELPPPQPTSSSPAETTPTTAPARRTIGNFLSSRIPPRILGVTYVAISAVVFSIQALFVSLLSSHMPSFQIVFFRCVLQFSFGFLACYSQGVWFLGPPERRKWLFVRGLVGFGGFSLYYYAMSQMTLADATTIFFTAPLYTGIMAYMLLGEPISRFEMCCTASSIAGVVMVVRPAFLFGSSTDTITTSHDGDTNTEVDPNSNTSTYHFYGVIAAIAGSLVSAAVYIAIRKVGPGVHPLVLVTYMGLVGQFLSPFGGIAQTFHWPTDPQIWIAVFLVGFFSFLGQTLFNAGVQLEKAGPASMVRNLDVAFSFMWQVVIEGIPPNGWSVIGAMVISAAVVAIGLHKYYSSSAPTAAAPPVASSVPSSEVTEPAVPTPDEPMELTAIISTAVDPVSSLPSESASSPNNEESPSSSSAEPFVPSSTSSSPASDDIRETDHGYASLAVASMTTADGSDDIERAISAASPPRRSSPPAASSSKSSSSSSSKSNRAAAARTSSSNSNKDQMHKESLDDVWNSEAGVDRLIAPPEVIYSFRGHRSRE